MGKPITMQEAREMAIDTLAKAKSDLLSERLEEAEHGIDTTNNLLDEIEEELGQPPGPFRILNAGETWTVISADDEKTVVEINDPVVLLKPVRCTLVPYHDSFIVGMRGAHIYTSGESEGEAVHMFKDILILKWKSFNDHEGKGDKLGPQLAHDFEVLKQYMREPETD